VYAGGGGWVVGRVDTCLTLLTKRLKCFRTGVMWEFEDMGMGI